MCSGGPLALLDGSLLGLLNSGIHDIRLQGFNACYGIPASVVASSLEKMFSGGWKGLFYPPYLRREREQLVRERELLVITIVAVNACGVFVMLIFLDLFFTIKF